VPADPLLIALPVLGGILGVGLLLLVIWKILTLFYDKIEYARFEHEIQNAKWSQVGYRGMSLQQAMFLSIFIPLIL